MKGSGKLAPLFSAARWHAILNHASRDALAEELPAMEHVTAALFAVLLYLFLHYLGRGQTKWTDQQAGPLLRRFTANRSLMGWLRRLAFAVLLIWIYVPALRSQSHSWLASSATFILVMVGLAACTPSAWRRVVVEFHERGILSSERNNPVFMPWASIEYCRWTTPPGRLCIVPRNSVRVLSNGSIRRGDIEEATAILRGHATVFDAERRVLNPEFKPAAGPAGPAPAPFQDARFQFSLRTLLFFVLVASSAMSCFGIHYRRGIEEAAEEKAVLARLERFTPKAKETITGLSLDFSASAVKPGDGELAILATLPQLEVLILNGATVTDAGLVHLEKLPLLRWVQLDRTQVTDAGMARLQRALPNAVITGWPRIPSSPPLAPPLGPGTIPATPQPAAGFPASAR